VREESLTEVQEWALRWRSGRLEDLGFPTWDRAMRIYGVLRPTQWADIPEEANTVEAGNWELPVWITELPATRESGHSLFHAVSELDEEERARFFFAFIALANQISVADQKDLGDAETLPATLEKAAHVSSLGLDYMASENNLAPAEILRRVSPERLFRVGVNLAPEGVRPALREEEDEVLDGAVE